MQLILVDQTGSAANSIERCVCPLTIGDGPVVDSPRGQPCGGGTTPLRGQTGTTTIVSFAGRSSSHRQSRARPGWSSPPTRSTSMATQRLSRAVQASTGSVARALMTSLMSSTSPSSGTARSIPLADCIRSKHHCRLHRASFWFRELAVVSDLGSPWLRSVDLDVRHLGVRGGTRRQRWHCISPLTTRSTVPMRQPR
jgi:hypothetical protein